jgi:hypothetical protein
MKNKKLTYGALVVGVLAVAIYLNQQKKDKDSSYTYADGGKERTGLKWWQRIFGA